MATTDSPAARKTSRANPCPPGVACSKCVYRKRMPQNPAGLCFACQRAGPRSWTMAGRAAPGTGFRPDAETTRPVRVRVVTVRAARGGGRDRDRLASVAAGTPVMVVGEDDDDAGGWRDAVVELACGGRAFVPRDAITGRRAG